MTLFLLKKENINAESVTTYWHFIEGSISSELHIHYNK